MCGIFGYIGKQDPLSTCLAGLEQLEYRGYDSTGIAAIANKQILILKEVGKLHNLKEKISLAELIQLAKQQPFDLAIGHTRWATHGKVTKQNAHPHYDVTQSVAIVHNGIIENFEELKKELIQKGISFISQTDTEVIVQFIAHYYQGNLVEAVQKTIARLKGQFALLAIHKDHPDQMVATARECPLSIGYDEPFSEVIVSSDPNAFLRKALNILFLEQDEVADIQKGTIR